MSAGGGVGFSSILYIWWLIPRVLDCLLYYKRHKRNTIFLFVLFLIFFGGIFYIIFLLYGVALRVDLRSSSVLEACFHWFCIDTFVDEVKISGGIVSFTPLGIDSAPCGCMDKPYLLSKNPARKLYPYTSEPIEGVVAPRIKW